jgi:5-carboxymethyl-2-hydroxymuconate isomerase
VHEAVGRALDARVKAHFEPLLATRHIGITLQIDEGDEVFNVRSSSLHPLFDKG